MGFRGWVFIAVTQALLPGQWFVGGGGGISTLSADGKTQIDNAATAISLYKPENGATLHVFVGQHWNDYFSVQGSYTWNRNALGLTGSRTAGGAESTYQQDFRSQTGSWTGEGMVYFRKRESRFRPYLSGGLGILRLDADAGPVRVLKGNPTLPPARFWATKPFWRTSVGIDAKLGHGFAFRYNFWETISANPISKRLMPAGMRGLANFQNVFSVLKQF